MNRYSDKTPEQRIAIAAKSAATRKANKDAKAKARADAITYAGGLREKIDRLEHELAMVQSHAVTATVSVALTGKTLLREREIVSESLPYMRACGVYFLIDGEEVVYVGQSVSVYSRIAQHVADKKVFDRYAYVPCNQSSLDVLESLYIHALRPKLNRSVQVSFESLVTMSKAIK